MPPERRPSAKKLEGWEERYVGQDPRLSEVAEMYRELGFEVRYELYEPEDCGDCNVCFEESPTPMTALYVRKPEGGETRQSGTDEDLF